MDDDEKVFLEKVSGRYVNEEAEFAVKSLVNKNRLSFTEKRVLEKIQSLFLDTYVDLKNNYPMGTTNDLRVTLMDSDFFLLSTIERKKSVSVRFMKRFVSALNIMLRKCWTISSILNKCVRMKGLITSWLKFTTSLSLVLLKKFFVKANDFHKNVNMSNIR